MSEPLPPGWITLPADRAVVYENELRREIPPGHVLYDQPVQAIASGDPDPDDVIFRLAGDRSGYAFVHLTWTKGSSPDWPYTRVYATLVELAADHEGDPADE